MNIISAVVFEVNKNGKYFCMSIPQSANYQEAEEVLLEMVQALKDMAARDPRNKPAQEDAAASVEQAPVEEVSAEVVEQVI